MQLGLTIPLQKFLKMPKLPYGEPVDLLFCWELHRVPDLGRGTLIAVNASNRFALVFTGMKAANWRQLKEIFTDGITLGLAFEGYLPDQIETYLAAAGTMEFTKTHGRKPVAGLNRAVDLLHLFSDYMSEYDFYQPAASRRLNEDLCHAAGFESRGYGYPRNWVLQVVGGSGGIGSGVINVVGGVAIAEAGVDAAPDTVGLSLAASLAASGTIIIGVVEIGFGTYEFAVGTDKIKAYKTGKLSAKDYTNDPIYKIVNAVTSVFDGYRAVQGGSL